MIKAYCPFCKTLVELTIVYNHAFCEVCKRVIGDTITK